MENFKLNKSNWFRRTGFALVTGVFFALAGTLSVMLPMTIDSASAHSRGPYFPSVVDVPGTLISQWDPSEYKSEDETDPHTREYRPFGLTGVYVLVKTAVGFELGYAVYDCQEIDDGAYGAMACKQATSGPSYMTLERFSSCPTPAPRAAGCL